MDLISDDSEELNAPDWSVDDVCTCDKYQCKYCLNEIYCNQFYLNNAFIREFERKLDKIRPKMSNALKHEMMTGIYKVFKKLK